MTAVRPRAIGADRERVDGRPKVTGTAPYAMEHPVERPAFLHAVQAPIARGRIRSVDAARAEAEPGVLAVLTHENAPRLQDDSNAELWILQDPEVHYRGQFVAAAVAETSEAARHAAELIELRYDEDEHDAAFGPDRDDLYAPDAVNPSFPTDSDEGDLDGAMAAAMRTVDETYTTPMLHNNPMEPHASTASWGAGGLAIDDSTQAAHGVRRTIAGLFGLDPDEVRVTAPYVGGGFGSKGMAHPHVVIACMGAKGLDGRPVRFALTRQMMFAVAGYRTPTIQRVRLAADETGALAGLGHEVIEQTSRIKEFAEQTAVVSRMMYQAASRRTSHRLAPLDVPVPSWMRAPGECPGMFGPECAMDELAIACGVDPIELRVRNEPDVEPASGKPWGSRNLVACLREGAERFGWAGRDPAPGARREGEWLVGTGVAASTYPTYRQAGSTARIERRADGGWLVSIGAADIGTGAWTVLGQIAADALDADPDDVEVRIGDTRFPNATVAGGSSGTASWGTAVVLAAERMREAHGAEPPAGAAAEATSERNPDAERFALHAFGAQFAEARVHADTGEVRVPRLLGVFAAGRIVNPRTARSQFVGGMTMGLSMALHEHSVLDPRTGHVVNHDLAEYHVAAHADVPSVEAAWIDEDDPHLNPMGSKGIGEIGIVGTAAAVANAVHHATGVRIRDLPITPDKLLG